MKIPKELLNNPVWADVWKFYTVLQSQPAIPSEDTHTGQYICEKLMAILERRTYWHHRIEEAFQEFSGRGSWDTSPPQSADLSAVNQAIHLVRSNGMYVLSAKEYGAFRHLAMNVRGIKDWLEND